MIDRFQLLRPLTSEDLARLKAYDLLDAIADFASICVVVALWSFFAPNRALDPELYVLCAAMGVASAAWHALVPSRFLGSKKLLLNNLLTAIFATLVIHMTGYERSPFFFLYYLAILGAALELGEKAVVCIAGIITVAYVGMLVTSPELQAGSLLTSISMWSSLASVWLVGSIAALSAHEAAKVRSAIEQSRDRVEAFSKIDALTGVYNRRHFDALVYQELSRAERYQRPLSLLLIDSDHLKAVNDSLGHQVGDQMLVELAAVITQICRSSDTVIRYGGDEFIVLLPETDNLGAGFLGERIRQSVEENVIFLEDERELRTTVSVGVASFPQDANDLRDLLSRADSALYRSKELGRNRTTVFSTELPPEAPDDKPAPSRQPLMVQAAAAQTSPSEAEPD